VFPTIIYMLIAGAFAFLLGATLKSVSRSGNALSKQLLLNLLLPLLFFWIALAYFSWRNFALYRGPGGTGGWYLWAIAIPEVLVLTWGATRIVTAVRVLIGVLVILLLLTIAGDLLLFAEPSGRVVAPLPNHHFHGLIPAPMVVFVSDFLASRPPFYAWAAIVLAASSWTLGVVCLLRTLRWRNYGLKTLPQSAPDRR